ncbi:MAG: nicotinamide riboside transporter PnuC [Pseudomonadales bacterium]
MSEISAAVIDTLQLMSGWEVLAVVLAIAYLVLAMRENILCWYCAFASTAIYTVLFWNVSLLMESALNVYYMAMAVYGWYQWRGGSEQGDGVQITRWSWRSHLTVFALIAVLSLVSGLLLTEQSTAAWPFVDSFTTWSSVIVTFMVARKVLENWLYWIVIDAVSVALYFERGLVLTSLLMAAYTIMAVAGYMSWRRHWQGRDQLAYS